VIQQFSHLRGKGAHDSSPHLLIQIGIGDNLLGKAQVLAQDALCLSQPILRHIPVQR
jgi:hypothetical protein